MVIRKVVAAVGSRVPSASPIRGKPPIEDLAAAFATFLAGLKYTDGTSVPLVDVVGHSMAGLIIRSYLSGKQSGGAVFNPPVAPVIRKAVFLASTNFGSDLGRLYPLDSQIEELASGSQFLFDLGTWNQGTDDLRGVDALALAGNAGSEIMTGFDDGVVALTSASINFAEPGRTRVVPYCHIDGGGIIGLAGFCPLSAKGIA